MVADVIREYREHWRVLLLAGLVVFAPLGLLEVAADHLQEPLLDGEADGLDAGSIAAVVAAIVGVAAGTLVGEVVYTGIVSAMVVGRRRGEPETLRGALAHLPLGRLVLVDLLWVLVVMVGFILLIVPGFVLMAWFALVAPACEIEDRGVRDSFRRSHELVSGHFWFVLVLIAALLGAEDLLTSAAGSISFWGAGEGFVGEWLASVLTGLVVSPLWALAAVVMFLALRERRAS